jgi:hypothetical protein
MAARKKTEDIPGTKAHQTYRLKDGTIVPGGSTIAKVAGANESSMGLMKWANRLGLDGHDCEKYRDKLADVGNLLHDMSMYFFLGKTDLSELFKQYSGWTIEQAQKCYKKFDEWTQDKEFDPIIVEGMTKRDGLWVPLDAPLVSEQHRFGGTVDYYGWVKWKGVQYNTLLDWKSSKYVYNAHLYQVAGYGKMLEENGYSIDLCGILRAGRSEEEGFEFKPKTWDVATMGVYWEIFQIGLDLYYAQRRLPKFWQT